MPRARSLLAAALLVAVGVLWAMPAVRAQAVDAAPVTLLHVPPGLSYPDWMARFGWEDQRPFSDSTTRFRIEEGALRLATAGDSYLVGTRVPEGDQRSLDTHPYLRFRVRIEDVPRGADLVGEAVDDSALRVYAVFRDDPPRSIVYAWTWSLPVGEWSARGRSLWGDFREVRRKAFGQGEPPPEWLLVEVHLRADYRSQFPEGPPPVLRGLALKADSNDVADGRSLAWIRDISQHATSLRDAGVAEGDRVEGAVVWFR